MISLRYRTSVLQNSHLSISNYRLALYRASRISLIYFQYLVRLSLYIRISLIYAVQKISRQGYRVLFIKCQNKLRAFIRPNGITKYLNNLYWVRNIVSYLSPFIIQRRLNIQIISSFIQMRALLSQFSISQINRIRYQFLTVIVLRAQQSIQKRKLLLGFLIKITSIAIGKELTLINPLSRYSSKYFYSTQSLFQDILYRGLNLGSFPFLITILQLYSWRSSSLLASFYKNISKY